MNDHYDGDKSDGLENGAKKHDYSKYTVNHYDDLDSKHKGGKDAAENQPQLSKAELEANAAMEETSEEKKNKGKKPAAIAQVDKEPKAEAKPQAKAQAKVEAKAEAKAEAKPAAKVEEAMQVTKAAETTQSAV